MKKIKIKGSLASTILPKMCAKKTPKYLKAGGYWNHFTGKKKYQITCGECEHTWNDKVFFSAWRGSIDTAMSKCPKCNWLNTWSHSKWKKFYGENKNG